MREWLNRASFTAGLLLASMPLISEAQEGACNRTATSMLRACTFEATDDLHKASAFCANSENELACVSEARAERAATLEECAEVRTARLGVCATLGQDAYQPRFGPEYVANFVNPRDIGKTVAPNPYWPLVEGAKWVYRKPVIDEEGDSEFEIVTVTVTNKTKLIDGIQCRVVRDVVMVDDELVEDTDDWIAQDAWGNVWYCGEEVKDYEYTEGDRPAAPELVSRDGSFKSGRSGAQAGILMFAAPQVGVTYREEADWGNAEDLSEVIATDATERAPAARCNRTCVKLRAFSPVEPGVNEFKFYAPGIGKIVDMKESTGARSELIRYSIPR